MYVVLDEVLPKTVTIINRLKAADIRATKDALYKTVLTEAQWDASTLSTMGDLTLDVGNVVRIQLPRENEGKAYLDYPEWINSPGGNYTASEGDIAILGNVTEEVDQSNLRDIMQKYKPNVCTISAVNNKIVPGISSESKTGAMRFLHFVYCEGV